MLQWPKTGAMEGRAEIYLRWPALFTFVLTLAAPLCVALLIESLIWQIILWLVALGIYLSSLPTWGPCVTAIGVSILPVYVYLEWNNAPTWLAVVAALIVVIEASYIRNRMRIIADTREREGVPV